MELLYPCLLALLGTGFTYCMTTLGAATVFVVRRVQSHTVQDLFLGFASGVMIAASVWSLLLPALEQAREANLPVWLPVATGFLLGGVFFYVLDITLPHLNAQHNRSKALSGQTKLFTAITLHNIPEGMAVGLAFALAWQGAPGAAGLAGAAALALGIGVQNFPEGAAIALPLHQEGLSARRSCWYGSLSGVVEPVGGLLTVLLAGWVQSLMPWLLSFAAGAMIYEVVDELIPDAHQRQTSNMGTFGCMAGFLIMMVLDVALG